jgi:hypothetical protein
VNLDTHRTSIPRCSSILNGPFVYKKTREALILSARDMAAKERKQYGKKEPNRKIEKSYIYEAHQYVAARKDRNLKRA